MGGVASDAHLFEISEDDSETVGATENSGFRRGSLGRSQNVHGGLDPKLKHVHKPDSSRKLDSIEPFGTTDTLQAERRRRLADRFRLLIAG